MWLTAKPNCLCNPLNRCSDLKRREKRPFRTLWLIFRKSGEVFKPEDCSGNCKRLWKWEFGIENVWPKNMWLKFAQLTSKFELLTIIKVKFLSKNSILTKPQHFHEFFAQIFLTIFLVKSKLSTAKKSQTTTFSRSFHPEKSTIFSRNQSWIWGQKMKISNNVL